MKFNAFLAAAALAAAVALPAQAQTLRWAAQNDILTMDPHSQNHATTNAILMHAYEGLTRYNDKYEVEPALATKWTFVSPTQVRFELRKGVKFHDGTPFGADDVVFSFGRIKQPQGTMQIYVTGVNEVKKIDEHTVDLVLAAPNPILLRNIVDFRIMSKAWAEKNNATKVQDYKAKEENFATRNVMGTGPYRILSWQPEQRVMMARNDAWWDKHKGNVAQVVYTPIKAEGTRVAALLSGDVDMLTDIPTQDIARLRTDKKLKIVDGPEVRTIFFAPDVGSPELKYSNVKGKNPFADKRVRQALSMAIDRAAIQRGIMRGLSIPANLLVAPGVNGHEPALDAPTKADADGAKKLLAEAGYPDGFETRLNCPNNRYVNDEEICIALATMWAQLKVKVKVNGMPRSTYFQKMEKWDTSMYLLGWGGAVTDAETTLTPVMRNPGSKGEGLYNYGRSRNDRFDALAAQSTVEPDVAKREALIKAALREWKEQVHTIPLHRQVIPWAARSNLNVVHRADNWLEVPWITIGPK